MHGGRTLAESVVYSGAVEKYIVVEYNVIGRGDIDEIRGFVGDEAIVGDDDVLIDSGRRRAHADDFVLRVRKIGGFGHYIERVEVRRMPYPVESIVADDQLLSARTFAPILACQRIHFLHGLPNEVIVVYPAIGRLQQEGAR